MSIAKHFSNFEQHYKNTQVSTDNWIAHIRHLWRRVTNLSYHRCLLLSTVLILNNIIYTQYCPQIMEFYILDNCQWVTYLSYHRCIIQKMNSIITTQLPTHNVIVHFIQLWRRMTSLSYHRCLLLSTVLILNNIIKTHKCPRIMESYILDNYEGEWLT